jgi:hypothetical protein
MATETGRIDIHEIPGTGPVVKKKSAFTSARDLIAKHKKSCAAVCVTLIVIAVLLIVWAHNCPDAFVAKYVPTWGSPDVKLLKKNHTGDTRRSDNKIDGWSKDDYIRSVNKFNSLASASAE